MIYVSPRRALPLPDSFSFWFKIASCVRRGRHKRLSTLWWHLDFNCPQQRYQCSDDLGDNANTFANTLHSCAPIPQAGPLSPV